MAIIHSIRKTLNARNRRQKRELDIINGVKNRLSDMIKREMEVQGVSCATLSKMAKTNYDTVKNIIYGKGNNSRMDSYLRMALALGIRPRLEFLDDNFEVRVRLNDTRDDV